MLQQPVNTSPPMGIAELLHDLRRRAPEVDTALVADLNAGTVICTSSTVGQPQEKLDGIVSLSTRLVREPLTEGGQFTLVTPVEVLIAQTSTSGMILAVIFEPEVDLIQAQDLVREVSVKLRGTTDYHNMKGSAFAGRDGSS